MTDTPQVETPLSQQEIDRAYLSGLDLDFTDYKFFAEHPDAALPYGRTTRFTIGKRTSFRGTLAGSDKEIECVCVVESARLNRVTLMEQSYPGSTEAYRIVTGNFTPCVMHLSLILTHPATGQEREVPVAEFLQMLHNQNRHPDAQLTEDRFRDLLRGMQMPLDDPMTLMWQQMGADAEKTAAFIDLILKNGAKDATATVDPARLNRIQKIYTIPDDAHGFDVSYFEVGQQDRERSRTGQGFVDFLESIQTNFLRGSRLRELARELDNKLTVQRGSMDETQIAEAQAAIDNIREQARSWMNNLSGGQEQMNPLPDADPENPEFEPSGIWRPVQAPIGRFDLTVGGAIHKIDLWGKSRAARAAELAAAQGTQPATATAMADGVDSTLEALASSSGDAGTGKEEGRGDSYA